MTVGCVALFLVASLLSSLASDYPFHTLLRGAWMPWILASVLLLAMIGPSPRRLALRWGAWIFLGLLSLDVLYQWSTGLDWIGHWRFGSRLYGFLPHPNDMALVALVIPFVSPWAAPLALGLVWVSGSRNAMLGCVVVAFMLASRPTKRWIVLGVALLLLSLMLTHADALSRGQARLGQWWVAGQMFVEAPWLGKGPHTFVDYSLRYLDRAPLGLEREYAFVPWAHNLYLEQLAERGLIGFAVFLLPLVLSWRYGDRHLRAALAAFLVMGLFDLTLLKPWVMGAYWMLVVLGDTQGTVTEENPLVAEAEPCFV